MWWILSISSALAQVMRNVIMKDLGHKLDEYINVWGRFTFLLPFALAVSLYFGIPNIPPQFWIYSIAFGIVISISTIYLSKAFKHSDISISVALWKVHVIGLLILGIIFLGEQVTIFTVLGILITFFGVYLLNISKRHISLLEPIKMLFRDKGLRYALIAGLLLSPASVCLKKTILLTDPYFPVFINFAFASLFMLIFVLVKSRKHLKVIQKHSVKFISMGLLAFLTTITTTLAFALTVAAYVEAVKQVEVLFALIAGMIFFKEHERIKEIWLGSLFIIGGIVMIVIFN